MRKWNNCLERDGNKNRLTLIKNMETIKSYSMHENEKYESVLKTLYVLNKSEMNRAWYFLHDKLHSIKKIMNKSGDEKELLLF
jgi:hypothetical protein